MRLPGWEKGWTLIEPPHCKNPSDRYTYGLVLECWQFL